ncbi:MAG: hypothetical protein J3Q66DRAFT_348677 [Benniella sp.]|nr:MAG: hypothetical protein J3Q66DRAFT_348677 [Benniella sp.]
MWEVILVQGFGPSWSHTFATSSLSRASDARNRDLSLHNPMEPSQVFAAQLLDTLPEAEIAEIQRRQNEMSLSLQKASSSLSALNEFSTVKWAALSSKFDAHTKLIKELQGDLEYIFRKIRTIKAKLNLPNREEDDDEEEGVKPVRFGDRNDAGDEREGEQVAATQ